MLRIGITGGIGSGKTTICKLFELLRVPVFYADDEAKAAMATDELLQDQLQAAFGQNVYIDGLLNRKMLAGIVFNNEAELKKLNSFVHPAVFRRYDQWVEKQQSAYVIKEAALLFETGSYRDCDFTILVKSPLSLKITRVMKRDAISEADVLKRIGKQLSDVEKEKLADFVINNNEQQLIIPQVLQLHKFLEEKASRDDL